MNIYIVETLLWLSVCELECYQEHCFERLIFLHRLLKSIILWFEKALYWQGQKNVSQGCHKGDWEDSNFKKSWNFLTRFNTVTLCDHWGQTSYNEKCVSF